jgi:hypothetical protein
MFAGVRSELLSVASSLLQTRPPPANGFPETVSFFWPVHSETRTLFFSVPVLSAARRCDRRRSDVFFLRFHSHRASRSPSVLESSISTRSRCIMDRDFRGSAASDQWGGVPLTKRGVGGDHNGGIYRHCRRDREPGSRSLLWRVAPPLWRCLKLHSLLREKWWPVA